MVEQEHPRHPAQGNPRGAFFSLCALILVWMLVSDPGMEIVSTVVNKATALGVSVGVLEVTPASEETDVAVAFDEEEETGSDIRDEQMQLIQSITEHCLPKLVCELYAAGTRGRLTDSETGLMALIGATQMSAAGPSKYHFAAHMGQLIRDFEGQGCYQFYPSCPFSGDEVRQIAKKIKLKG